MSAAGTPGAGQRRQSRLRVVHRTVVEYPAAVETTYNEVRMTPATLPGQLTLEAHVEVTPRVAAYRYTDYFGARVVAFDTHVPHERLEVVARSLVETDPGARTDDGGPDAGWEALRSPGARDDHVEWLTERLATRPAPEVAERARELASDLPPAAAAVALSEWVHDQVTYVPGSTGVHTSAAEAWRERRGVCQDLAHVVIGGLREAGIPARYVSGYLHPRPDAPPGETVAGESHAWVEWWVGRWQAYDPTNVAPAGPDHVVVARGRDYGDVPPMRGVYSGPAASVVDVTVEVTRVS